ncbi:glycoside hydrolase family 18 protein [Mycena albidolilacea]|uniref:chitinase n=1 Tax=Mycena albidolilacea TaxID=1033008 RepID=A0AAD6YZU4_9AGAR|nr:glycoside hydrolase family 18 protein [Mycena albidolilacea]
MFRLSSSVFSALVLSAVAAFAYDPTRSDNLVVYWGQNSYGATHGSDVPSWQQTISNYCQDTCIDVIPIAFIDSFSGGIPDLNLGNESSFPYSICNDNGVSGSCASLAAGIQACQAKGKLVTLSLGGGGTTTARFGSDAAAISFADTIWNDFLGGSSGAHRPFGAAVLDGVDLDIESGNNTGYAAFANRIRTLWAGASKPYYLTAAPQCPSLTHGSGTPSALHGSTLSMFNSTTRKIINSGVKSYPSPNWNFATWNTWAQGAPNPNVKIFIGAPASPTAANSGEYVSASNLGSIALATRAVFSNFGGVMLWDASQAYGKFDSAIKNILTGTNNCGATGGSGGGGPGSGGGGGCTQTYTVKDGDTCLDIESRTGVTVAQLHALNPAINSDCTNLIGGQILCV